MNIAELAAAIDQTMLKQAAGAAEGLKWIEANCDAGFATLCVSPFLVPHASRALAGTSTKVCSVVAFPLGYALTESKVEEALHLLEHGCAEVDMVLNVGALLECDDGYVRDDIAAVVEAVEARSEGAALVKVILETGLLDDEEIVRGCDLAVRAGAQFVKTSTGFGPRGASIHDVELMRGVVGADIGVKAAGGIRDLDTALAMLQAGASRIGTSSGLDILSQAEARDR